MMIVIICQPKLAHLSNHWLYSSSPMVRVTLDDECGWPLTDLPELTGSTGCLPRVFLGLRTDSVTRETYHCICWRPKTPKTCKHKKARGQMGVGRANHGHWLHMRQKTGRARNQPEQVDQSIRSSKYETLPSTTEFSARYVGPWWNVTRPCSIHLKSTP